MKVERLPSGNYRCKVYLGVQDGKKKWKSITGPNKKSVLAEASQYALSRRGEPGSTVSGAVHAYISSREATMSPSTIVGYKSIEKRLKEHSDWFMSMPLHRVSSDDLQHLVDEWSVSVSPKTVSNIKILVNSSLKKAGCVIDQPSMPMRTRPDIHIPSEETVQAVIEQARGTSLEIPILLAAYGPLRRGEICALSMGDISGAVIHVHHSMVKDENGKWIIKPPKTSSSDRYIQMMPEVIDLINKQGYVTRLNPDTLGSNFARFLRAHGLPHFRFHDLRHWSCSYMHAMGVPDQYIIQRSGHADSTILRRVYTHTLQDQNALETERINNAFRGNFRGNSASQK